MRRFGWLCVMGIWSCVPGPSTDEPPATSDDVPDDTEDTVVVPGEPAAWVVPTVTDLALDVGLQGGTAGAFQRGRACIAADFDLDGTIDMYVGNPGDQSYVLLQDGGDELMFSLEDVLLEGPLAWAASASDYDNDGDIDLYVSVGGNEGVGYDRLLQNQTVETGTFSFVDVTQEAGIAGPVNANGVVLEAASANGVWGDYDGDGDNDLFVSVNVFGRSGDGPLVGRNIMWRNDGDGTFSDATSLWGVGETKLRTRHSTALDIDNDGDLDLYENNFRGDNVLWRNDRVETGMMGFTDITRGASGNFADLAKPRRSFASVSADFNNDGWEDLLVYSRGLSGAECGSDDPSESDAGAEGHALFLNLGPDRGFVEVAEMSGINAFLYERADVPMLGDGVMGCQVGDFNADGYVDIFVGNGGPDWGNGNDLYVVRELQLVDFGELGEVAVPIFEDWTHLIDFAAPDNTALGSEPPPYPYRTHGSCAVDFDRDGLVELFVSNGGPASWGDEVQEPDRLFHFDFAADDKPDHLAVRLRGDGERVAMDAVGSRVAVTFRGQDGVARTVTRRLYAGSAFSAQNSFELFFGLGKGATIERVEVTWPDGVEQVVSESVAVNELLEVVRAP